MLKSESETEASKLMMDSGLPQESLPCPNCGGPTRWMSAPDGSEHVAVCPNCSHAEATFSEPPTKKTTPPPQQEEPRSRSRFRDLIAETHTSDESDRWPDEILEDLPEEARALFSESKQETSRPDEDEDLDGHMLHHLREQGYVISQDGDGLRLDSSLSRPGGGAGTMSPHDIVKLVADMEGGVVPPAKRLHCPKCQAMTPSGETRCQWCGEPLQQDQAPTD